MAGLGKVDIFAQQAGYIDSVLQKITQTRDQLWGSGLITNLDIAPETEYLYPTVSSYGSTVPVHAGSSADLTHSNVIATKTTKDLKQCMVSFQYPTMFSASNILPSHLEAKAYALATVFSTLLGSSAVETDIAFGGLGSYVDGSRVQSISAGGAGASGALTLARIRETMDAVVAGGGCQALVGHSRTRRQLITALEALNYQTNWQSIGANNTKTFFFDGIPYLVNDYIPLTNGDCGAVAVGTRLFAMSFDPVEGFMSFYSGQLGKMESVHDNDSMQTNYFLALTNNFVLKNSQAFAQLVGISN